METLFREENILDDRSTIREFRRAPFMLISFNVRRNINLKQPKGLLKQDQIMNEIDAIFDSIDSEIRNPTLNTWNGIGADLFGHFSTEAMGELVFKIHFFCFFFIPIIPLGIYLVKVSDVNPVRGSTYIIYGKIGINKLLKMYGFSVIIPKFIFTVIMEIIGKIIVLIIMLAILYSWAQFYEQI